MKDCIFCKIVEGKIPSYKVYEDKHIIAFLDVHPLNKGHLLVIPKKHYSDFFDTPKKVLKELIMVIKKIMGALDKLNYGEGYTLVQNNRKAAEQDVPHIHFHIIPRNKGDKSIIFNGIKKLSLKELKEITKRLEKELSKLP